MIAATSGGAGDIIYSIPVMQALDVKTVYVKESFYPKGYGSLYSSIKPLLELNGFEVLPTSGAYDIGEFEPGLKFNYNLDLFREMPKRGRFHVMKNQFLRFTGRVPGGWRDWEWLKVDDLPLTYHAEEVTIFAVTPRWREGSKVDWTKVWQSVPGEKVFLGFQEDAQAFQDKYLSPIGETLVWYVTNHYLDMARAVRDAKAVYCNQNAVLTMAQGLGKPYFLEVKPNKTNTLLYRKNETIL